MAIETNELIDVKTLSPFKRFIMTIGNLPTSYLESMTYGEMLMWFCNYLQETVIPTVNNNAEAVEELQNLYEELKNYVDHYFENLDVQQEINNKLDEMARDGSLTNLISAYLDPRLNEFESEINDELNDFSDEVNNRINSLASGQPKGVYATTADLISANPETGIYLITADGYVYSFTHNASSVTQLVQYQTTGLAENSISLFEIRPDLKNELINEIRIQSTVTVNKHWRIADGVAYQYSYNGYSSFVTPVQPNEIYHLKLIESSANTYGYIFVDDLENLNVVQSGMKGTGVQILQDSYVKVPSGAGYMLSSYVGGNTNLASYYITKVVPYSIKALNDSITTNCVYSIPSYTEVDDTYYHIEDGKGVLTDFDSVYKTVTLNVKEGEAFYLKAYVYSLNTQLYLVLDNSDNIVLSGGYGNATGNTYTEANIIIPPNGTKLCISFKSVLEDLSTPSQLIIRKKESMSNYLADKNISILGDSISTKANKNAVEIKVESADVDQELSAYLTYYDVQGGLSLGGETFDNTQIGTEVTFTPTSDDIGKVIGLAQNYNSSSTTTYWELLESNLNCKVNSVSWSGASLSSHQKNVDEYKTSYGWHEAQIRKLGTRIAGSMDRIAPDLILIYRGVNDFSHTPYTTINTSVLEGNYTYPLDDYDSNTNKYDYVSALGLVIKKIRETYPDSKIAICTLGVFKRVNYSNYPTRNGLYTLPQFNEAIRKCADFFGLDLVELDKDGITFENCYSSGYITDSATTPTHPNSKGHEMIYKQVVKDLQ